jgi:hypothetical protein
MGTPELSGYHATESSFFFWLREGQKRPGNP